MSSQRQGEDKIARDQEITFYADEQTKHELEELAAEHGTTRSTLVYELVRKGIRREREGDVSAETRAAERLQDLLDEGLGNMENVARQIQDLNAKTGVYAVAAFELVKKEHGEAAVEEALRTGSRRLREDNVDDLAGDDPVESDDGDRNPGVDDGRNEQNEDTQLDLEELRGE